MRIKLSGQDWPRAHTRQATLLETLNGGQRAGSEAERSERDDTERGPSAGPIFITGAERSGTSLMFALLASHPDISMVRRTNMFRWFHGQYGDLGRPENFSRCLDAMLRYQRLGHLQPDPDRIRREFAEGDPTYGRLFSLFHQHHAERLGKRRWGDKSLHTEYFADALFAEFPSAKLIHMIRDPRDRYASISRRYEKRSKGISAATRRWIASCRASNRNRKRHAENTLTVKYETLAQEPEGTLREVCAFLGESYRPEMLSMEGAPEHGREGGNSSFTRFQPGTISTQSIGRFRDVLSGSEIAFIQTVTLPLMHSFQYVPEKIASTVTERSAFYLGYFPLHLARLVGSLALEEVHRRKGDTVPADRLVDVSP